MNNNKSLEWNMTLNLLSTHFQNQVWMVYQRGSRNRWFLYSKRKKSWVTLKEFYNVYSKVKLLTTVNIYCQIKNSKSSRSKQLSRRKILEINTKLSKGLPKVAREPSFRSNGSAMAKISLWSTSNLKVKRFMKASKTRSESWWCAVRMTTS